MDDRFSKERQILERLDELESLVGRITAQSRRDSVERFEELEEQLHHVETDMSVLETDMGARIKDLETGVRYLLKNAVT